jgi:transposase
MNMPKPTKKHYSEEFRKSSAQLAVDSDQSIAKTAEDLGIKDTTLYNWVSKYCPNRSQTSNDPTSMAEELRQLKKENMRLKQERDILKKAAAYFASET